MERKNAEFLILLGALFGGFQVPSLEFPVPSVEFRVSIFELRVSGFELCLAPRKTLNAGSLSQRMEIPNTNFHEARKLWYHHKVRIKSLIRNATAP